MLVDSKIEYYPYSVRAHCVIGVQALQLLAATMLYTVTQPIQDILLQPSKSKNSQSREGLQNSLHSITTVHVKHLKALCLEPI